MLSIATSGISSHELIEVVVSPIAKRKHVESDPVQLKRRELNSGVTVCLLLHTTL